MAVASSSACCCSASTALTPRAAVFGHSPQRLPSICNSVCLPLASCRRIRFVSSTPLARQLRPCFLQRAAQTEAKVINKQEESDASDSDYESTDDESNGQATQEPSLPSVASMLEEYKEAVSNNDESALVELNAKFELLEKEKVKYVKQVASLTEEVSALKDRLLRLNADFDNFRKRAERDRIAVGTNVKGDVVNSLLPMVDNFERAKMQIKIETEGEQRIDSSYQGIYKQFVEIMKGLGVAAVETVGKEFDPNVHEAIMREESSDYPEGTVIEEFRRGFMLGEKLLRPSMVKVSSGPPAATPEMGDGESTSEVVEEAAATAE